MNAIAAARLSKRVLIQSRGSSKDSFGEPLPVWSDLASVWADVQPLAGRELETARRLASEVTHVITVRFMYIFADTNLAASYRALHQGRIFNIHASVDEDGAGVLVNLYASVGLNDG